MLHKQYLCSVQSRVIWIIFNQHFDLVFNWKHHLHKVLTPIFFGCLRRGNYSLLEIKDLEMSKMILIFVNFRASNVRTIKLYNLYSNRIEKMRWKTAFQNAYRGHKFVKQNHVFRRHFFVKRHDLLFQPKYIKEILLTFSSGCIY